MFKSSRPNDQSALPNEMGRVGRVWLILRSRARRVGTAALVVGLVGAGLSACGTSHPAALEKGMPVAVMNSRSASTWVQLLRAGGYSADEGDLAAITSRTSGVVPADASLSADQVARLVSWVKGGGRLATGNSSLLKALGIAHTPAKVVTALTMKTMSGVAEWGTPLTLKGLSATGLRPLATSKHDGAGAAGQVLMGSESLGSGNLTAFAIDPVANGREGYELMPRAAALVGQDLEAPPGPQLDGAEIFVDPGGLSKSLESDPTAIAALAAESGARIAEIAAWDYDFTNPADDYDYSALIDALHARGILAYAWLEPPFVTLRLWQDHPECREKTESGRDALVGWRSLIALEDPACFKLAATSWSKVLDAHQWDGVNFAELYFQPESSGATNYTPFSAAALKLFGHNPATDPTGFATFRTDLVTSLDKKVLEFANGLTNATHLGFELTVIDNTLDPIAGNAVGSNIDQLAMVAKSEGASLMVEDPASTWADGPLRYDKLGPHVASLMPPQDSLLDVNVVDRVGYGARPTLAMIGSELDLALDSATAHLGRVGIYALGTLSSQDLGEIPAAMAASTATTDLGIYGHWTVKVTAPAHGDNHLTVDGLAWPAAGDTALVPPGNHVLDWSHQATAGPGLVSFTGQIGTASTSRTSLRFSYDTHPDGLVVVNRRPVSLLIDGSAAKLSVIADPAGGFVVRVPAGTHRATIGF
jgi:hypothetical protein